MLRFRLKIPGVLFAAVLLAGCDHDKPASQSQSEAGTAAVTKTDSDSAGESTPKHYRRALPVTLPPAVSEANPPSDNTSGRETSSSNSPSEASAATTTTAASDAASSAPSSLPSPPGTDSSAPAMASSASASSTGNGAASQAATTMGNPAAPVPDNASASQEEVVVLQTSLGQIVIQLDSFAAPKTCDNFRKLVSDGFYNHTVFHRVIPNFVIQGGDPNSRSDNRAGYGQGGPGYTVPPEIKLKHDRGAVAMARLPDSINPQRESNGSQFYICVAPCPSLDDQYTVFGHVIKIGRAHV